MIQNSKEIRADSEISSHPFPAYLVYLLKGNKFMSVSYIVSEMFCVSTSKYIRSYFFKKNLEYKYESKNDI